MSKIQIPLHSTAMPRSKNPVSNIQKKKRSSADGKSAFLEAGCFFYVNGARKWHKLGIVGKDNINENYRKFCKNYWTGSIADDYDEEVYSLGFLVAEFFKDPKNHKDPRDINSEKQICKILLELYPDKMTHEFGAKNFRRVQEMVVRIAPMDYTIAEDGSQVKKRKWSRQYVNKLLSLLRRIFAWGVSYDLVPPEVLAKMKAVPSVRAGDYEELTETTPRVDVSDEVVRKTLPFLSKTVADMVRIQRGACLRPSELCGLRVGDLDREGDCWRVKLTKHKTARCGVHRYASFSRAETEILRQHSAGKRAEEYLFSPKEAMEEHWQTARKNRKTKVQPSQMKRGERRAATRTVRLLDHYDASSYRQAIEYGIAQALKHGVEIPHWTPYQLRHAAVTATSLEHGREIASLQAGHLSISTTAIYDHKAATVADRLAAEREAWWESN